MLEDAIVRGSSSDEFFGIARGLSDGRYVDLSLGVSRARVDGSDLLVKPGVARAQFEADEQRAREEAARREATGEPVGIVPESGDAVVLPDGREAVARTYSVPAAGAAPIDKKSFRMAAKLDPMRVSRSLQPIMEEVVSQLNLLDGVDLELTLEVKARAEGGISVPVIRAISENCSTLGINDFRFDE